MQAAKSKRHGRDRRKLQAAYTMPLQRRESSYLNFIQKHIIFLKRLRRPLHCKKNNLPLGFIETVGIECALWPYLYHKTDMCPTYVRHCDDRRQRRLRRRRRQAAIRKRNSLQKMLTTSADMLKQNTWLRYSQKFLGMVLLMKFSNSSMTFGCGPQLVQRKTVLRNTTRKFHSGWLYWTFNDN